MKTFRCVICNKVNSFGIETNVGDYVGKSFDNRFVPDYKYPDAFICHECDDSIQDCLYEYHIYDLEKEVEMEYD